MTFVGVDVGVGRARLKLTGGNLACRLISADSAGARVALVATTALLLGGDRVDLEIAVGPGAWLEIVETAGTVAYDAGGMASSWKVRAGVATGGLLLWQGQPFVVASGANTLRSSRFELEEHSVLCLRETVVLGRSGEVGGAARIRNRVCRRGEPLLVEDLDLRCDDTRRLPGVLGATSVLDTVTSIGASVPEIPVLSSGQRFDLDHPAGTIGRALRSDLAGSPAAGWWSAWSDNARQTYRNLPV